MKTVLNGHDSPETAYVVEDYPYSFRLRCKMRHWIEFRKGFGMRHVTQTSNPKRPGLVWNKPKAGTYHTLVVLVRNEDNGHIENDGIHFHAGPEAFKAFRASYYDQMTLQDQATLDKLEEISRKASPTYWAEWEAKQAATAQTA